VAPRRLACLELRARSPHLSPGDRPLHDRPEQAAHGYLRRLDAAVAGAHPNARTRSLRWLALAAGGSSASPRRTATAICASSPRIPSSARAGARSAR
jgi:hypothetical protein